MAAESITHIQDCQLITKTFERGCNHSLTEESVFAVMTPKLAVMRSMSKQTSKMMGELQEKSTAKTSTQKGTSAAGILAAGATNESLDTERGGLSFEDAANTFTKVGTDIKKNFIPGGDSLGGIFNSECIPCGFRINFKEDLNFKLLIGGIGDEWLRVLEAFFENAINQLLQLINMFKNLDKYIDLCAFLRFLNDFICIPDLQRILALFAAFMMQLALELDLSFDLLLSLIAPLFMPFLSGLMNVLNKYLLMILKPIECIIDSIQNILSKLDYNVLFQNFQNVKFGFGAKIGSPPNPVNATIKIPIIDKTFSIGPTVNDPDGRIPLDPRSRAFEVNLSAPFDAQAAKEQASIEKAAKELQLIRQAAGNVDASDPKAVESYRAKETQARNNYEGAVKEKNLSEIGKLNSNIEQFQTGIRGAFFSIINYLRAAAAKVEAFIMSLLDEFKKIIAEFMGGSSHSTFLLNQKLEILQLVSFIIAIIKALKKKPDCDEGKEVETFLNQLPTQTGMKVWSDDNGDIHIQEEDEDLSAAIDGLVAGTGITPINIDGSDTNPTRQKLRSLIDFTGDPLVDSQIARAVDDLTTPASAVFKCPLQTSVAQAEQVNKWIMELGQ